MVLPGHLAGGYLAASAFMALAHPALTPAQIQGLLVFGALAGDLPDIDLFWFWLAHRRNGPAAAESHRDYATHTPIFWLAISAVITSIGWLSGSAFTECVGVLVLIGSWAHLLLDSIEYGVVWLWPFSHTRFALKKSIPSEHETARPGTIRYYIQFITESYWKTWTIWAETALVIIALYMLFKK